MNRRTLLSNAGLAIAGLGMGACAPKAGARTAPAARAMTQVPPGRRPPVQLPLMRVSYDRIIRETVGLRPHRPSGFVLKSAKLDTKTVIHNYGHGGSGMSLSWGTGAMAADMALAHAERRAAVLGCGAVGLAATRQLQRRGFAVTIYAATVPPDTTSNYSLAGFTPTSGLVDMSKRTPEWESQFRQAVDIAYRQLQFLVGPTYGISWVNTYAPTDNPESAGGTNILLPAHIQGSQVLLQPGEHPFQTTYAVERPGMRIEPGFYLDAMMHDVLAFGAHIVIRKFETPRDIMALSENVIVNCTGLGAKALFGDDELVPLKGQLILLTPQEDVNYGTNGGVRITTPEPGLGIHMMPRRDGIALGGTSERDVWTLDINQAEKKRVVDGHIALVESMRQPMGHGGMPPMPPPPSRR